MNKISIALCTFNGAQFLPEQLESLACQTRPPDELIVSDDKSSDESVEIIKNFAGRASFPVQLHINEKNLGSTKNFEHAISLCTGDLIFLSDQDDIWLPEKIAMIEAEFEKDSSSALVFSDAELIDENSNSLGRYLWDFTFPEQERKKMTDGNFYEVLLRQNVVTGGTMAFRSRYRKIFLPIPVDIPNLIHDGWISLVISVHGKVGKINQPLIKYRQHSRQQLGLNLKHRQKQSRAERTENFSESIIFHRNEKARLLQMMVVLTEYPQFKNLSEKNAVKDFIKTLVEEKERQIHHYETRKSLPLNRLKRLIPITGELFGGGYHRFSRGFLSAAKDLIER